MMRARVHGIRISVFVRCNLTRRLAAQTVNVNTNIRMNVIAYTTQFDGQRHRL